MATGAVTFTFIRHGESTDNVQAVWAGWADATLTVHGMNQAQALATSLSTTNFDAILSSPLKRAHMTAQEVQKRQRGVPPLTTSPLLKERHFGIAEGKASSWKRDYSLSLADHINTGVYPSLAGRSEKFPDGESLDDVQVRAAQAWEDLLLKYVLNAAKNDQQVHVAVVSHGIFIKEAIRALAQYDSTLDLSTPNSSWLRNTGWARVVVQVKDDGVQEGATALQVQLTHFNDCAHLNTVKRQKGGIGRAAYDARQKDIRKFFGNS
ncbi:phosphoglycerate mutase-like protein [Mycena amicta]|nr:phosphoglycerate mutase-like protein [Mycena amicta]